MLNLVGLASVKLVGVAVIVVGSCLGIGHLISVMRGDDIKISKEGYSAKAHKRAASNFAVNNNTFCEE